MGHVELEAVLETVNTLESAPATGAMKYPLDSKEEVDRFLLDWIAALRSGKWRQGYGALYDAVEDGYCCWGVACELLGLPKRHGGPSLEYGAGPYADGEAGLEWRFTMPPAPVMRRITRYYPTLPYHDGTGRTGRLDTLNDSGKWNFEQIAGEIERRVHAENS